MIFHKTLQQKKKSTSSYNNVWESKTRLRILETFNELQKKKKLEEKL